VPLKRQGHRPLPRRNQLHQHRVGRPGPGLPRQAQLDPGTSRAPPTPRLASLAAPATPPALATQRQPPASPATPSRVQASELSKRANPYKRGVERGDAVGARAARNVLVGHSELQRGRALDRAEFDRVDGNAGGSGIDCDSSTPPRLAPASACLRLRRPDWQTDMEANRERNVSPLRPRFQTCEPQARWQAPSTWHPSLALRPGNVAIGIEELNRWRTRLIDK